MMLMVTSASDKLLLSAVSRAPGSRSSSGVGRLKCMVSTTISNRSCNTQTSTALHNLNNAFLINLVRVVGLCNKGLKQYTIRRYATLSTVDATS